MIDLRKNEIVIVENLKKYLTTNTRPCEVIRQNQVSKAPPYPYVSYTVTTLVSSDQGTYCENGDGTLFKNVLQTWSFTVQSDDQDEAMGLALRVHAFFSSVGVTLLADNEISVIRVRDVTTRDNLMTIEYEYRSGLDVTFGLSYEITPEQQQSPDVIESIEI